LHFLNIMKYIITTMSNPKRRGHNQYSIDKGIERKMSYERKKSHRFKMKD